MTITHMHVHPDIGGVGGDGSDGDPYGDLEFGISDFTFGSEGNQINILGGVNAVLATSELSAQIAAASLSPGESNPLIFRGMTLTPNDGGLGGISGDGSFAIWDSATMDYIHFRDLDLQDVGENTIITVDDWCTVTRCKLHGGTGSDSAVVGSAYCQFFSNYMYDWAGSIGFSGINSTHMYYNYIEWDSSASSNRAIYSSTSATTAFNIVVFISGEYGIWSINGGAMLFNSVYSPNNSTGQAFRQSQTNQTPVIIGNIAEGFSGAGGEGFYLGGPHATAHSNAVYDCTTPYNEVGLDLSFYGDNEILIASPFVDAANRDFSRVDIGNVVEGVLPEVIGGGLV